MLQLNAPAIAADKHDLLDVLWFLSEWAKAQCNSPALAAPGHSALRARLSTVSGELQALQADIALSE